MSRLNRKLNLNVISEQEADQLRNEKIGTGIKNLKEGIRNVKIEVAPPAPAEKPEIKHEYGADLAEVAISVYRTNINPKEVQSEIEVEGPDTHASRVNKRSINRALMGLRNGGDEGKLSMVGPNGNGNVGKYSPGADNGNGNATNNQNNYYALTTDMTLEQYEDYIGEKFERQYKDKDKLGQSSKRKKLGRGSSIKDGSKKDGYESPAEFRDAEKKYNEDAIYDLEKTLLEMSDTSWVNIDKVMRSIAKENDITPLQLHREFKSRHGMIPDDWAKQNQISEEAGIFPLQELARLNPAGVVYDVTYVFRGGTQRHKFLWPSMERPSKEQMEEAIRGFWPFARLIAYYPSVSDNEQNNNYMIAVPPMTENFIQAQRTDWNLMSEIEADIYDIICEEEGEPISPPFMTEDGGVMLMVEDHDTGEIKEIVFNEACWKGYTAKGMKKKGDKMVPNCVPVTEEEGKKDACYHKVKSRYKVWPSAYASGALVKCRKKGASSWGNSSKKEEFVPEGYYDMDDAEKKEKDRLLKGMSKDKEGFEKRYGKKRAPDVMYATARNKAKKRMDTSKSDARYAVEETELEESEAWTRKEGKSKAGGLNEKGRKSYEKANPGSDLKAPSKKVGNPRRASFCARMKGMKKKLTSSKTANDPDSRINKSLRAWNCGYEMEGDEMITEGNKSGDSSLHDWFNKSKSSDGKKGWVQLGGKYAGKPCAKQPGQTTKPKCGSSKMKRDLSDKEEERAFRRKNREDGDPNRSGKAKNVKTEEYVTEKKIPAAFRQAGGGAAGEIMGDNTKGSDIAKAVDDTMTVSDGGKALRRRLYRMGGKAAKFAGKTKGLGTALSAGAAIGDWMNKNLDQNVSTSGRGAGRSSFKGGGTITK